MKASHPLVLSKRHLLAAALSLALFGCGGDDVVDNGAALRQIDAGAVSSPDQFGAATAKQILDQGGNAVDAAVATAFTLAVTLPCCGNIGGGGFMTVWMDGKPYFIDYREKAPSAATPTSRRRPEPAPHGPWATAAQTPAVAWPSPWPSSRSASAASSSARR